MRDKPVEVTAAYRAPVIGLRAPRPPSWRGFTTFDAYDLETGDDARRGTIISSIDADLAAVPAALLAEGRSSGRSGSGARIAFGRGEVWRAERNGGTDH